MSHVTADSQGELPDAVQLLRTEQSATPLLHQLMYTLSLAQIVDAQNWVSDNIMLCHDNLKYSFYFYS